MRAFQELTLGGRIFTLFSHEHARMHRARTRTRIGTRTRTRTYTGHHTFRLRKEQEADLRNFESADPALAGVRKGVQGEREH